MFVQDTFSRLTSNVVVDYFVVPSFHFVFYLSFELNWTRSSRWVQSQPMLEATVEVPLLRKLMDPEFVAFVAAVLLPLNELAHYR